MTGPTTRSRAQQDEGSSPPQSRFTSVANLYPQKDQAEPSSRPGPQGGQHEEQLPPPPTMAKVLMQIEHNRMDQTRILKQIARNTSSAPVPARKTGGHRAQGGLAEFQRTNPPVFSSSEDPMEAEDWLRNIEKKLLIAQCSEREKVLFASYQLDGAASA